MGRNMLNIFVDAIITFLSAIIHISDKIYIFIVVKYSGFQPWRKTKSRVLYNHTIAKNDDPDVDDLKLQWLFRYLGNEDLTIDINLLKYQYPLDYIIKTTVTRTESDTKYDVVIDLKNNSYGNGVPIPFNLVSLRGNRKRKRSVIECS